MKEEIIYFELNNWTADVDYPDEEPFLSYVTFNVEQMPLLAQEEWLRQNRLVVVMTMLDMSLNFTVTAPKSWVLQNCPKLLTEYKKFLCEFDEDANAIVGKFSAPFLEYTEDNIGIHYFVSNDDGTYSEVH